MATGTVKMFDESKGFGFITPTDGGKDLYVNSTGMQSGSTAGLREGARVEYTAGEGPKGPLASNVRTITGDAPSVPQAVISTGSSVTPKSSPVSAAATACCDAPSVPQPAKV